MRKDFYYILCLLLPCTVRLPPSRRILQLAPKELLPSLDRFCLIARATRIYLFNFTTSKVRPDLATSIVDRIDNLSLQSVQALA